MTKDILKLYSLAKVLNHEVFLDAQLQTAGSRQAKYLERLENSKNNIRNGVLAQKVSYALVLCILPILPLITYFQMQDFLGSLGLYLSAAFIFSIFFGLILLYTVLLGMLTVSSFMSGNAFKWLRTLPVSKEKLKRLGFLTIFRSMDLPLIVMAISFPIIMIIGTRDLLLMIVCALTAVPNVLFCFSFLIFIGEKMSGILYTEGPDTKKKTIIRMLTMVGYIVMAMSLGFVIQWAFSSIDFFFKLFVTLKDTLILNMILSLIPFPFAPSFLISIFSAPASVPSGLWITSITGYIIFLLVTWGLYKVAVNSLNSVIAAEKPMKEEKIETIGVRGAPTVEIDTRTPIKALVRKDLITITRDFQSFMFVLMPVILPSIMIFSSLAGVDVDNFGTLDVLIIWSFAISTNTFIPPMLVSGFLGMEESGSTILASLPILPRKQAKAKILIMLPIQTISMLVGPLIMVFITRTWMVFIFTMMTIPLTWSFLFLVFELKVKFFGQMEYKYVLEEVYRTNNVLKWIAIVGILIGVIIINFIVVILFVLFSTYLWLVSIIILCLGVGSTLILWYIFNRMFPKLEEMGDYKTGGALRESPALGAVVLTVLYWCFVLFLPQLVELLSLLPFIIFLPYLPFIALLFIDFGFIFGFLALLWIYIVPFELKLPEVNQKFDTYFINIGLGKRQPFLKNILIGVGSFVIFSVIVLLGGLLLGNYTFDLNLIFGPPSISNLGWFLFVIMLIPGIWEEVSFRGVLIPTLRPKYSRQSIIIISGITFGLFHTINFINILAGVHPLQVVFQIIYASLLGFAFGYIFLKTKSLLPTIILHYLIDSVGMLFLNVRFDNWLLYFLYCLIFIGIIPMILIMVFVKYLSSSIEI